MNSPSPSKPKWTPGGAIRRTSTLLSIGRPKTPSRSSSIQESDSPPSKVANVKGTAAKTVAASPPAPTRKPVPPKSTLPTGSPSQEPTVTPSKSPLARMGTVLRRPSSLMPRRRTTSTASSLRDGDSTRSKAASAIRSSTELEPATKPNPVPTVPEPRSEPEHVLPPVIESTKIQSADKPEEAPSREVVAHSDLSSSRDHAVPVTKEALDESLALSAELAPILLLAEQISAEPEVVQPSLASVSTVPVPEQAPAQVEDIKSYVAPVHTPELVSNAQLEAKQSSPAPISTPQPVSEQIDPQSDVQTSAPVPLPTPEPAPEQIRPPREVVEPLVVPQEPVPAPHAAPSSETKEQSTVFISTKETVPPSPTPPQSVPDVIENALPSSGPTTQHAIVETPPIPASPLPVTEAGKAPSSPKPEHITEPLREVSSLNSSFEDLSLSTHPADDEVVVVQKDIVVDYTSVLLTPAGVTSVPLETTVKEKSPPLAVVPVPVAEEAPLTKTPMPILEITKEHETDVPNVPAFPVTQEPRRTPPLEIPTTSMDSAGPSPAATHPLLPLEVQEFPPRQNNGPLGPMRDHHAKTPQEYRSILRQLFDGLVGLIRHWRRCLW